MAMYVTGDTHGEFNRFNMKYFPGQEDMSYDDKVIICGDFGGVWDNSKCQDYWLDWLDNKPFTTLFVCGNHENFDLLKQYPEDIWNGGRVHFIRPHVIHLMRGQIYQLDGKTIFTMGGAKSHDIKDGILEPTDPEFKQKYRMLKRKNAMFRVAHKSWWMNELPSHEEYVEATINLNIANWKVDYIFSHCAPSSIQLKLNPSLKQDALTSFLDEVKDKCTFQKWFFGHYHVNAQIEDKFIALYEQIREI